MKKSFSIKICAAAIVLLIGLIGFSVSRQSEMQPLDTNKIAANVPAVVGDIEGYKNWTKVNYKPQIMFSRVAMLCADVRRDVMSGNDVHADKYINVYVNAVGAGEMLTKEAPLFPQGTIIVKEKLSTPDDKTPELLTVMIKREKNYNAENGDWEYMTASGDAAQTTARGKLESCQRCHAFEQSTDYVSRNYLPAEIRKKLK